MSNNNTISPAYPTQWQEEYGDNSRKLEHIKLGFTKLELGTFMIAQGLVSNFNFKQPTDQDIIATIARQIAETILIELEK